MTQNLKITNTLPQIVIFQAKIKIDSMYDRVRYRHPRIHACPLINHMKIYMLNGKIDCRVSVIQTGTNVIEYSVRIMVKANELLIFVCDCCGLRLYPMLYEDMPVAWCI